MLSAVMEVLVDNNVMAVESVNLVPETPTAGPRIATESELERFATLSGPARQLTDSLRGVLVETALTGIVRYDWSLLRPVVEHLTEKTLREYDAAAMTAGAAGPSQPAFQGESLDTTVERFKSYLGRFSQAPWTLQRLCEVLLAPSNQYTKLHKVALAIEKCLLVTSEVAVTEDLPPPPTLTDFTRPVNSNPPPVNVPKAGEGVGGPDYAVDMDSNAFTHSLLGVQGSPPGASGAPATGSMSSGGPAPSSSSSSNGNTSAPGMQGAGSHIQHHHGRVHDHNAPGSHGQGSAGAGITPQEHMEEDHWPEAVGRPGLGGVVMLHGAHHHAHPGRNSGGGGSGPGSGGSGGSAGGLGSPRPGSGGGSGGSSGAVAAHATADASAATQASTDTDNHSVAQPTATASTTTEEQPQPMETEQPGTVEQLPTDRSTEDCDTVMETVDVPMAEAEQMGGSAGGS